MDANRTLRRHNLGLNDLRELSALQHRSAPFLEKLIETVFRGSARAPIQWWKAQESLVERLCRYLCDIGVSLHHGTADEVHSIEKKLRDQTASHRGKVSFGHYVDFLRALGSTRLGVEGGPTLTDFHSVLTQPVPTQLREFVLAFELLKDAGSFGIPGARVGSYIEKHRKGRSAGKATLNDVLNAYSELRNAFHHASEDEEDTSEPAGKHDWWSNKPDFVAYVASESAWALRHLLCWAPLKTLLSGLEVVRLATMGGRIERPWPSKEPLGQADRFSLEGPLAADWKPGTRVLARRTPDDDFRLRTVSRWVRYPECRRPVDAVVDGLANAFATRLVEDGHVAAQQREELEKTAASEGIRLAFATRLKRVNTTLLTVLSIKDEEDEGDENGGDTAASGLGEQTGPPEGEKPAEDDSILAPPGVTDDELVRVLLGTLEPSAEHRDTLLRRLGSQLEREFKDEGMTTAYIVSRYGGYSSDVAKLLLETLAKVENPTVFPVDRNASADRQDTRYTIVDTELRTQMSSAVGTLEGIGALAKVDAEVARTLLNFASVAARLYALSISDGEDFEGRIRLLREKALQSTGGATQQDGDDVWLDLAGQRISARSQVGLLQALGEALSPTQIASLPTTYRLSAADIFYGPAASHRDGHDMELPVRWARGDGAETVLEANWPRPVLFFHLAVVLEMLRSRAELGQDWGFAFDAEELPPAMLGEVQARAERTLLDVREPLTIAAPESLEGVGGIEVTFKATDDNEEETRHIVGPNVPQFMQCLLDFILEEGWLDRALAQSPTSSILPIAAGRTKAAISHAPFHLNGRPMERYASRHGVYLDSSLTWKNAIANAIRLLRDDLGVRGEHQPRPVKKVSSLGAPTRQAIRLGPDDGLDHLPQDGIEGNTVKEFVASVVSFIEKSAHHRLPPLPVSFKRRVFVSETPTHPDPKADDGTRPFRAPLELEYEGRQIFAECHQSVDYAVIKCKDLIRLSELAKPPKWWLIAPGQGGVLWNEWKARGVATLGWNAVGDIEDYDSREEIEARLMELSPDRKSRPSNDALALWEFGNVMAPGDIVLAKSGRSGLLGWGVVQSECEFSEPDEDGHAHRLLVAWRDGGPHTFEDRNLPLKTLTNVSDSDLIEAVPWRAEIDQAIADRMATQEAGVRS